MRLIDADDLLWYYEKRMNIERPQHRDHAYLKGIHDCIKDLESRPTVESEQTTGKWISIKSRPMDENERKEWEDIRGYKLDDDEAVIYTSLPDDGQEVLICLRSGDIRIDTFEVDFRGCYFNDYDDIENVVAWMPLPEPWRNEQ